MRWCRRLPLVRPALTVRLEKFGGPSICCAAHLQHPMERDRVALPRVPTSSSRPIRILGKLSTVDETTEFLVVAATLWT